MPLRCWWAHSFKLLESGTQERTTAIDLYHAGRGQRSMRCSISMRNIFCLTWKEARQTELRETLQKSLYIIQALNQTILIRAGQALPVGAQLVITCHLGIRTFKFTTTCFIVNAYMMRYIMMKILTQTWATKIKAISELLDLIIR